MCRSVQPIDMSFKVRGTLCIADSENHHHPLRSSVLATLIATKVYRRVQAMQDASNSMTAVILSLPPHDAVFIAPSRSVATLLAR